MTFLIPKLFCGSFYKSLNVLRRHETLRVVQRCYSEDKSSQQSMKVSIIGAAGGVGQPLSLMLKQCQLIDEICLYDVEPTEGIARELQYIDTKCKVTSQECVEDALKGAKVIVILAAKKHSSYMEYENMFDYNAPIVKDIIKKVAKYNNKAFLAICTNPVNSLVPMATEILKKKGKHNPKTIFGVTSLDVVRANTLVAEIMGIAPECVTVPVIGGNTKNTIVPVLSQAKPCSEFTNEELEEITRSIKRGHEIIVKVKRNEGAQLSAAFSIARFVISLVKAQQGVANIVECAYVESKDVRVKYLSNPVLIGPAGVAKNLDAPKLSDYESCQLENAIEVLKGDIRQGEHFVGVVDPPSCDECDPNPNAPRCPPDPCEIQAQMRKD